MSKMVIDRCLAISGLGRIYVAVDRPITDYPYARMRLLKAQGLARKPSCRLRRRVFSPPPRTKRARAAKSMAALSAPREASAEA